MMGIAADLLYPEICPLCEEILLHDEKRVCKRCSYKISYVSEPCCLKCGKEIDDEETEYCKDCEEGRRTFIKGFPAMNYENTIRESVAKFKYSNKRTFADFYAYEIYKRHGEEIKALDVDALIPVPVHKTKLRQRGYNQAELLADSLSAYVDAPVDSNILVRNTKTLPQKELNNIERELNLKNAFNSNEECVQYNKVMLVDDIYTTGATIEACTCVLHRLGIKDVYYTSICIGKRD